ncbi:hypothetical protein [Jannaschia rubra]|uniref:Uncharacterized protein n=1 Tax=Jannaschia rubra TaxID=282197 RepID=A0A0M6XLN3_9RHOB|nr:hypothetical protein [Jannaschia rubra]CTQ31838.1 hypothetical protein JAN5088_00597 [Jannaschia rubra]SFG52625.1 hypothetical protein SAMN04488517_10626 [Jannaschia rubra]
MTALAAGIGAFIVALLLGRAIWILRAETRQGHDGRPRGIPPGTGYTQIDSNYSSGLGGGHQLITRVPKDPQEYARAFVPRHNGHHRSESDG